MENKKGINFFFAVIAIITGSKLYQHFDSQKWTFEKPALDIIYLLTFVASIFFIVKDYLKPSKK